MLNEDDVQENVKDAVHFIELMNCRENKDHDE